MSYDSFPKAPNLGHDFHHASEPQEPSDNRPDAARELDHAVHHHSLEERAYTPGGPMEQSVNQQLAAQGRDERAAMLHEERTDGHEYYLAQIDEAQQRMVEQVAQARIDQETRYDHGVEALDKSDNALNRALDDEQDNGQFARELDEAKAHDEKAADPMREDQAGPSIDYDMPTDPDLVQEQDRGELGIDHGPGPFDQQGEWDHGAEDRAYDEHLQENSELGTHDGPGGEEWGPSGGGDGGHDH